MNGKLLRNSRFFMLSILVLGLGVSPLSAQVSSLQRLGGGGGPTIPIKGKVVEFRVSVAGNDKTELMRVFLAVQELEKKGELEDYKVMQRINLREFLVYKKTWAEGGSGGMVASSMRAIGGGGNVYVGGGGRKGADKSIVYWLKTKEDHDVADGETLSEMFTEPTGKTREYTSVLGAKKTCRELAEMDKNVEFSKEDFLAALKEGKTWTLVNFSKSKCSQCGGSGKLGALKNYAQCPGCKGKGGIVSDCLVKW